MQSLIFTKASCDKQNAFDSSILYHIIMTPSTATILLADALPLGSTRSSTRPENTLSSAGSFSPQGLNIFNGLPEE